MASYSKRALQHFASIDLPEPQHYLSRKGQRRKERKDRIKRIKALAGEEGQGSAAEGGSAAPAKRAKAQTRADQALEALEQAPRRAQSWEEEKPDETTRLPIKVNRKVHALPKREVAATPATDAASDAGDDTSLNDTGPDFPEATEEEPVNAFVSREKRLQAAKEEIARLCSSIIEDPEGRHKLLADLLELCRCKQQGIAHTVKNLAILSTAAVFKDIIPGYRVRSLSEKERDSVVSKDVAKLRAFEQGLLTHYQAFLKLLHNTIKPLMHAFKQLKVPNIGALEKHVRVLGLCAVGCLSDLLAEAFHFNFRNNIIETLVPLMTGNYGPEVKKRSLKAARTVIISDDAYDATLDLVRSICTHVKAIKFECDPEASEFIAKAKSWTLSFRRILRLLLLLRIQDRHVRNKADAQKHARRNEVMGNLKKSKDKHATRRKRKELKAEKQLSKELLEIEATTNTKRLSHNQTQILAQMFAVFFRVLKFAQHSPILSVALEGLGRFAHLIDTNFYDDIFRALEDLIGNEQLTLGATLSSIKAAFRILSGEGRSLTVDPSRFLVALFRCLAELPTEPQHFHLALDCINSTLLRRVEISVERVAAFAKRLLVVSLHMEHHNEVAALVMVKLLLQKYPRLQPMLDNDTLATGVYMPEMESPEHTNALTTALWELEFHQDGPGHPALGPCPNYGTGYADKAASPPL
ncbi:uncharacterized protein MONBRDRAFT_32917 [Monosiga brevicollis MX1]|uniref:Nucleolar complex-associated protein 3-like protein n=1 Tax=Monosiga brevicollis TaxID=81824 RepID=A9V2I5_MONBE|nr:uncharacterized protein MONBRDRAFT_32917 [Monosiga brevicollis MX1]EDQ88262.1 predicted protein [Monosiga brevicollis MX1]|eukprot:XP_001746855.1 hypothetical protein [Monosiga brevicollis MX1]